MKLQPSERVWAAIGSTSGRLFELSVGSQRPVMLPPCSNQDLPVWIELVPRHDEESNAKS